MFKTYSTVTNKFYDTLKEAEAAEAAALKKADDNKAKIATLNKRIAEIKSKQVKEVTAAQNEISEIENKIVELNARKNRMASNIGAINAEATLEINECTKELEALTTKKDCCCKCNSKKSESNTDECSFKVKTFNSDTDSDWKTVIDKSGTTAEVTNAIKALFDSDTSLKDMLSLFNI